MTTGTIDLNVANMALQRRVRCFKPAALTLSLTFLLIGLCNGIEYVFVADVATGYVECGEAIDEDRVCLHGAQDLVRTAGFRPHEQEGSCFYCYVGNVVPEDLTLLRDFMALVNPDIDWVPDAKNFVNNYNLRERHFEYNYRLLELAHRYNVSRLLLSMGYFLPLPTTDAPAIRGVPLSDDVCSICLQPCTRIDHIAKLSCSHLYHMDCLIGWLKEGQRACPICRKDIKVEWFIPVRFPNGIPDHDVEEVVRVWASALAPGHGTSLDA
ncbi:RING-type domain-containing protein [Plasmodiophora brassicae]|uniref:RING-type domain-containing protein n=1 Tax=Plasmodiophora brassicae TaxID=37360 RepID=A0A0G4IWF8_PLABS|nr:hypothetical protein PBRA_007222 [Plasmodiophora brassicae]